MQNPSWPQPPLLLEQNLSVQEEPHIVHSVREVQSHPESKMSYQTVEDPNCKGTPFFPGWVEVGSSPSRPSLSSSHSVSTPTSLLARPGVEIYNWVSSESWRYHISCHWVTSPNSLMYTLQRRCYSLTSPWPPYHWWSQPCKMEANHFKTVKWYGIIKCFIKFKRFPPWFSVEATPDGKLSDSILPGSNIRKEIWT